jgi:spore maturation protein CgeB
VVRIFVFGSSIVSAYWNGAATYYRGIFRALHDLGWEVHFCEPDIYDRQANRDLDVDPKWVQVRVYSSQEELEALQAEAAAAPVVAKCTGVGARDDELERWLADLAGPLRVFWDVDAAHTLAAVEEAADHHLRGCIPAYDLVLTYGGGEPVLDRYRALGAPAAHAVNNGLDPDAHHPAAAAPAFACDLLFMGNRLPDRERRVDEYFIGVAEALPRHRFILGGNGWAGKPLPANVRWLGHVPTRLHNALNCSARLVLNLHRDAMVESGHSPATRLFEAAGAGACQITDAWEGIDQFFAPGSELLVARSPDDVARFVRDVDVTAARRIGAAARQRALVDHRYSDRAARVDALLRAAAGIEAPIGGALLD